MYSFKNLPTPVSEQLSLKQAKYRFKLYALLVVELLLDKQV